MKMLLRAIASALLSLSPVLALDGENLKTANREIIQLLSAGKQKAAEKKVEDMLGKHPGDAGFLFWQSVLERSRFNVRGAAPGFAYSIMSRPDSPEGLASACVLGIDMSKNQWNALYYFDALLIVCEQNPKSIPIHWMAAVMVRTLTNDERFLAPEVRERILMCGVREYETVLSLMAPGPGPVLIHQTMANLLDDLEGYDLSLRHREIALQMERAPWSIHAAACTLLDLTRYEDALPLAREAVSLDGSNDAYYGALARANWALGLTDEAINAWDEASQLDPDDRNYLEQCAMGHRHLGNYAAARQYTRKALANDPDDRFFKIWDARFAAMLGEPGASELVRKAGEFDFRGKPIPLETTTHSSDPWFDAVETGDLQKVRQLMGTGDINRRRKAFSQTALMIAAEDGWEAIAAELIKAGAKLDEVDTNRDTALHYSADFTNPRVMKLLLDAGASTDLRDKWGQTPLIMCASDHNWSGFLMLLEKKADVNLSKNNGNTALHHAAGHGDVSMINALLQHGAEVNAADKSGRTPISTASEEYPHSYNVLPLLKAGADVNAQDKEGRTPLHHAVNPRLNIPLVEILLENGADPTLKDKNGVTPINKARLLGFDEIAGKMEDKFHGKERLRFPEFAPADSSLSLEMQNASFFVLPILLAQGDPLGRPSGVAYGDKKSSRKELERMFGIRSAKELKEVLEVLENFQPRCREDAAHLPLPIPLEQINQLLKSAAEKIHASCNADGSDETAWIKSHVVYLADLGAGAGFLPQEESDRLISTTSAELGRIYSSWPQFMKSFVLGAKFHSGWEALRYQHVCQHILEAGPLWP